MSIRIIDGGLSCDNRGVLRFVNEFNPLECGIKRMYQVENNPTCEIRAWHGHMWEDKFVYCARGSAIVAAIKMIMKEEVAELDQESGIDKYVLSALQPRVLHIPAGMANGFRTLEPGTILIFYSTSALDESKGDDFRFKFKPEDLTFNIEVR